MPETRNGLVELTPRYRWKETHRAADLTIVIVARDLVRLGYPFIESFISTLPLGCHYLVGVSGQDGTRAIFEQLAAYAPVRIVDQDWPCDKEPGWGAVAIGICTQRLLEQSPTDYCLNLQACEIHTKSALETILGDHPWVPPGQLGPWEFKFNHFYGSMNHGGPGYGGYPHAPRLFKKDTKIDRTDGWVPNEYCGGFPHGGWVHRYGYCHHNTIRAKLRNHQILYSDGDAETKIPGCINLGNTRTWFEEHPHCVRHLVDRTDYDVNFSLDYAKKHLL
jgi:hypothetical protein